MIYASIIYKVLCINRILHAIWYSFAFTDIDGFYSWIRWI